MVDLWGGFADEAQQRPWQRDTIVNVYSTTKTMAALAADPAQAKELVKLMPEVGVRPSASSFTPLIAHAPDFRAAREWLGHMRETGVSPNSDTLTALMKRAGSHQEAAAVLKDLQDEVEPNEGAYRILVDVAPDFASARRWVDQMRQEGMRPSGAVLTELLSKPPSEMSGNELLAWYLALDHHPSAPMQAAIEAYRAAGQIRDALRLALDYPHIEAARTLFGLHREEALDYLTDVVATDPGHANGHYALGLALLELGRTEEALRALELARELARPGPRVVALEEIIRHARDSAPTPSEG